MPYVKQTFVDHETKLSAAHLNHIEEGIEQAYDEIPKYSLPVPKTFKAGQFVRVSAVDSDGNIIATDTASISGGGGGTAPTHQSVSYPIESAGWTRIAKLSANGVLTRFDLSISRPMRLEPPLIRLSGTFVHLTIDSRADTCVIFANDEEVARADQSFDLSTLDLPVGTYSITAKCVGADWYDSLRSEAVIYEVALAPGLYTAQGDIVASWSRLTNTYGMNVQGTYAPEGPDWEDRKAGHPASILTENPELAVGSILIIPGDAGYIASSTFGGCKLTEVVILDGVTSIGQSAFLGCPNLARVVIPGSVRIIGTMAFELCKKLSDVELHDGLTTIGLKAFDCCYSMNNISFPGSLKTIEAGAFTKCPLSTIALPNGLETVGAYAFQGCNATSVTIPSSVKTVGSGAFSFCQEMTDIFVEDGNENYESIPIEGDDGTMYSFLVDKLDLPTLVQAPCGCPQVSFTLPYYLQAIGKYAFGGSLCATVTIPSSIQRIEDFAFSGCLTLNILAIPQSVTYIGAYAFQGCASLVGEWNEAIGQFLLTIGGNLEKVAEGMFIGCELLAGVRFEGDVPKIETNAFLRCSNLVYVSFSDALRDIGTAIFEVILPDVFKFVFGGTQEEWDALVERADADASWLEKVIFANG